MPVLVSGGGLVGVGGDRQPYPRNSVPLSQYGESFSLSMIGDGRVVSFAELYRTQLWVGIAVNKITRQISRLPLKVYKRTKDGRERVRTGALPYLLDHPFPRGGSTHLLQSIALPTLIHGNSALRKARDAPGMPPSRLEPLSWPHLRVHGDRTLPVQFWETTQPGMPRGIDPDDVVHTAWRGVDGPIGVSPLQQLAVTISIEDAVQRHQQAQWKNGARPPSAVIAGEKFLELDKTERQVAMANLREDITNIYAGPEKAGLPAVLPPGVTWEQIGHTAVEAELVKQRVLNREEVAACYDVPGPMIGQLERSTFNNIEELHRMLYVTVLGPWLDLIEETLKVQLIDPEPAFRGDLFVEFSLEEVLRGDTLQRSQALALQIGYGILTIDEARDIENRARFDLPETKVPLYPANNLKPVGLPYQGKDANSTTADQPSESDLQDAAQALAQMHVDDVRSLLAKAGGSTIDAIFALADPETRVNGHHPAEYATN